MIKIIKYKKNIIKFFFHKKNYNFVVVKKSAKFIII